MKSKKEVVEEERPRREKNFGRSIRKNIIKECQKRGRKFRGCGNEKTDKEDENKVQQINESRNAKTNNYII